jgi:DNA-binding beta-propeller fold protein YncE
VYVADANDNAIYVYNNVPNALPIQVITQGLHTPMGLCVDSAGNLYVANNA